MISLKAKSGEDSGGHLQPHVSKEKEKEKEKEKPKPKKKEDKTYRPGSKILLGKLRAEAFVPRHAHRFRIANACGTLWQLRINRGNRYLQVIFISINVCSAVWFHTEPRH